jgi:glycerol-3-phosphate dehydrogenase
MLKTFSHLNRNENLSQMPRQVFDLAIVGGGITGAGVARDATSRGMSVALVEANDFAFGTSSRSSKLIHGGLRYLENGDFHLVYEALNERGHLFEMAPHLVHPLRFLVPLYKGDRVGPLKMELGMLLYDLFSLGSAPEFHEKKGPRETLVTNPYLKKENLLGSLTYFDAYMDDAQLVLETLRSANDLGARIANFVKVKKAVYKEEKISALDCEDVLTGNVLRIHARHFVSTTGPWTDIFGAQISKNWKPVLRPSKGIHLTLPISKLPIKDAVVMAHNDKKRIVFVIPRNEFVIVGTTESVFTDDPALAYSTKEDANYILNLIKEYFPQANLSKDDFISSYAGIRPLVADDAGNESKTSREHLIFCTPENITFVAGGKYTTYRLMAEQIVNSVLKKYFSIEDQVRYWHSKTKTPLNPSTTRDKMFVASRQIHSWSHDHSFSVSDVQRLADQFGMETLKLLELAARHHDKDPTHTRVRFAIQNTMCLNLIDFYLRRSNLFLSRSDYGFSELNKIGQIFSETYGWSDQELKNQKQRLNEHIQSELSWKN